MSKMMTALALFALALCSCVDLDGQDESEVTSELTGTVTCQGTGGGAPIREGTCTASSAPTAWTIQAGIGTWIYAQPVLVTNWHCTASAPATRLVTAVGVGTATVSCSRYLQ